MTMTQFTVQFPGSSEEIPAPTGTKTAQDAAVWALRVANGRHPGKLIVRGHCYHTRQRKVATRVVTVSAQ